MGGTVLLQSQKLFSSGVWQYEESEHWREQCKVDTYTLTKHEYVVLSFWMANLFIQVGPF